MPKQKNLYTVLSAIMGVVLLYSFSTFIYYSFKNSNFGFAEIVSLIIPVIAITGVIISFSTGFKKTALLRLFLCLEIFSFPFTIFFYIRYFTGFEEFGGYKPEISAQLLINIFLTVTVAVCSAFLLWHLSREQKPKITFVKYGEEKFGQFEPAAKGLRFANRLIDLLVMWYFIYQRLIEGRLLSKVGRDNEYLFLTLLEAGTLITFYLLLESIFNTTPGKCATNTVIVNENGERPNFGQILGRTFARLIPFDALSFFSARGWHDSLSGTYVVSAAKNDADTDEITLDAEQNITP